MPEYINHNPHTVHLTGPDGKTIKVRSKQRITLGDYFDRYRTRGFIKLISETSAARVSIQNQTAPKNVQGSLRLTQQKRIIRKSKEQLPQDVSVQELQQRRKSRNQEIQKARKIINAKKLRKSESVSPKDRKLIVGRRLAIDATELLRSNLEKHNFPVSNNIGVGIMSYNRVASLRRLIQSIAKTTDLRRTTVFISDDASTEEGTIQYLNELETTPNFVVIRNNVRGGIAVNTNRLIRCLSRFNHGLILNDDVEVLKAGWDEFYAVAMQKTGMHHFQHRQPGVYGAKLGDQKSKNSILLRMVTERPQGAIMAFSRDMLVRSGYFNEDFGIYGMEHVDWSMKAWENNLQEHGFFDVDGSADYFRLHSDTSAVGDRSAHLKEARKIFEARTIQRCGPTEKSKVPEITYVIPFRDTERNASIQTVVDNIRGQKFPVIHIIMVEQDSQTRINIDNYNPVFYYLAHETKRLLFNKSIAFNLGVSKATTDSVILHDADMVVQGNYTKHVYDVLRTSDACHLGNTVVYSTKQSTDVINTTKEINKDCECERVVGYFEGGSLACRVNAYWRVGGFNEDFWGYGCFAPGNMVATQRGYVNIEEVLASDKLLTHAGFYREQIQRIREYSGIVLDIFIPGRLPIRGVTPEHPFLLQGCDGSSSWVKANELRIGDILGQTDVFPDLSPSAKFMDLANDKSQNKFDIISNQNSLAYLMGMYLSEGVIQDPQKLRTTYFFLHEGEEFLAKHIADLIYQLNPNINVNYDYIKNTCRHVVVSNSFLAKFIFANAGKHNAKNKILSTTYLNDLTDEAVGHLLGGAIDGDGGHQFNSEKRLVYHSSSYNLAFIISSAMRRLGIAHSFGRRKGGGFRNSQRWSYDLTINREFEHLITSIYPKPEFVGSNSCGRSQFGRIFKINIRPYSGLVYNFEVDVDKSYCVQGIYAHNCEDCDFYARLASCPTWKEDRVFDFLHLWHGRVDGWNQHHNINKSIESNLKVLPIKERINLQLNQLRAKGYDNQLKDA